MLNTLNTEDKIRIAVDLALLDVFSKKGDVGVPMLTAHMQSGEFMNAVSGYLRLIQTESCCIDVQ